MTVPNICFLSNGIISFCLIRIEFILSSAFGKELIEHPLIGKHSLFYILCQDQRVMWMIKGINLEGVAMMLPKLKVISYISSILVLIECYLDSWGSKYERLLTLDTPYREYHETRERAGMNRTTQPSAVSFWYISLCDGLFLCSCHYLVVGAM